MNVSRKSEVKVRLSLPKNEKKKRRCNDNASQGENWNKLRGYEEKAEGTKRLEVKR
jgi:hypothetical protein